jgi:hypothetical protein
MRKIFTGAVSGLIVNGVIQPSRLRKLISSKEHPGALKGRGGPRYEGYEKRF